MGLTFWEDRCVKVERWGFSWFDGFVYFLKEGIYTVNKREGSIFGLGKY